MYWCIHFFSSFNLYVYFLCNICESTFHCTQSSFKKTKHPSPDVSRDRIPGKTKLTSFPRDHILSALLYILHFQIDIFFNNLSKTSGASNNSGLYPGRDTFKFDQGNETKNQPNTVLVLLSESLGI